jgi:hypothetical protein
MNCKDCISLLEDYLYRQLNATAGEHLATHLAACEVCAGEYALLRREQEIYAGCELQVAPEFWNGVRTRITREKRSRSGKFGVLAGLWSGLRFKPALAVAACCLIVVCLAGLLRYIEAPSMSRRATTAQPQLEQQPSVMPAQQNSNTLQVVDAGQNPEAVGQHSEKTVQSRVAVAVRRVNPRRADISAASRDNPKKAEKPGPGVDPLAEQDQILAAQTSLVSDLDADSARHLERAGILLRSFKNGRLLPNANTLDLNYERRISKDLMGRNILLRRDAELAGNVALARLLDRLEPFLLEIANLRDDSARQEVRLVREGLMREQIIAALQTF